MLIGIAIGLLVVVGIVLIADAGEMLSAVERIQWGIVPLVLLLVLGNYVLRFAKWTYYLKRSRIEQLETRDSLLIFLSGFSMAMTPGKVGELLKGFLVRNRVGVPVSRVLPIIFAERVTDAAAVLVLSGIGLFSFRSGWQLFIVAVVLLVGLLIVLHNERLGAKIIDRIEATRFGRGRISEMRDLLTSARDLLAPTPLASMLGLSVVSWFFECVALFVILRSLGVDGSWSLLLASTFVFATSAWIGGLTLIPGGLGATEASAAALLVLTIDDPAMSGATAAVATLLLRFATLWFGVIIGIIALFVTSRWSGVESVDAAPSNSTASMAEESRGSE